MALGHETYSSLLAKINTLIFDLLCCCFAVSLTTNLSVRYNRK